MHDPQPPQEPPAELPCIFLVDDDDRSLAALREAMTRRYGGDYRIVAHRSGAEALAELASEREAGAKVALVLAAQWMCEMTGVDLLRKAHALHPEAQRALLVAWGDRSASQTILEGCAAGDLENYLLKPWSPAEVHLYPVIGEFLRDKDLAVVGGGNSAGQAVVHLARYARRVVLAVRGDSLSHGMSDYLVQDIRRLRNVEVRLATEVVDADGERSLERVTLRDRAGREQTLEVTALFALLGALPHTEWLEGAVERDRRGFVLTGRDLADAAASRRTQRIAMPYETSMPGVFAAGDVRAGSVKRLASAVGEGAIAVRFAEEYLAGAGQVRAGIALDSAPRA